jgi:hypothetical protein
MAESDISLHDHGRSPAKNGPALSHARRLILRVCQLAGTAAFIDEAGLGPEGKEVRKATRTRNTAALFDHLVAALNYQGISDEVAKNFMDRHGLASWYVTESALRTRPSCPKLRSYWHFYDCRYNKSRFTCAEPNHLADCPCRDPGCVTAASIKPPIRCICSCATLLTATWSAGSTGGYRLPTSRPDLTGWHACERRRSTRCGKSTAYRTKC